MLNVKRNNNNKYVIENVSKAIFLVSALIAVVSLLLIIGFVFYKGLTPFVSKGYSFRSFYLVLNGYQAQINLEYYLWC